MRFANRVSSFFVSLQPEMGHKYGLDITRILQISRVDVLLVCH